MVLWEWKKGQLDLPEGLMLKLRFEEWIEKDKGWNGPGWKMDDMGHRQKWRTFHVREWYEQRYRRRREPRLSGNGLGKEWRRREAIWWMQELRLKATPWKGVTWPGMYMKSSSYLSPPSFPSSFPSSSLLYMHYLCKWRFKYIEDTIPEMFKSPWGCWEK